MPPPILETSNESTSGVNNLNVGQVTSVLAQNTVDLSEEGAYMETLSTASENIKETNDTNAAEHLSGEKQPVRVSSSGDRSSVASDKISVSDGKEDMNGKHKREHIITSDESNGYREVKRSRGRTRHKH